MNTTLKVTSQRTRFSPLVVTLLLGFVLLFLSSPSAQAQTNTADTVDSSVTISAKGTVNDPGGAITVSGDVIVSSRRVIDTTGVTPAIVVLDLDFSKLQGTSGSLKTLKVFVTGENHTTELRPLQVSDTIIVTCPYFENTKDSLSAKTFLVTATLNFDVSTGKVTGGSINVGNNVITKEAVGGATTAQM
ncbi:MAG TPA: hypothetical protein VFI24_14575 [Pyrinomonadaceae bacterium]|nr:hypothetical protein [Pyrinomonadaceae bacterium]